MQAPIKIKNNHCEARVSSVEPICGSVRVQGWISAPSRDEGFTFCGLVAEALRKAAGRSEPQYLGGFCFDEKGPVHFPFSFDVEPGWNDKWLRGETKEELVERINRTMRKVARAGIIPTGIA